MMTAKHQLILIRLHIVKNNLLWRTKKKYNTNEKSKNREFSKQKQKKMSQFTIKTFQFLKFFSLFSDWQIQKNKRVNNRFRILE